MATDISTQTQIVLSVIWTIIRRTILASALLILIAMAVYCAAGRYFISSLDQYTDLVQDELTNQLGVNVSIGNLSGAWSVFDPIIHVSELSVGDEQTIFLGQASFRLSFSRSLIAGAPRFRSITFRRPFLSVQQDSAGQWKIRGLPEFEESDSEFEVSQIANVIADSDIVVYSAALQTRDPEGKDTHWLIPKGSLNYHEGQLHANGEVLQPGGQKALAQFSYVGELLPEVAGNVYLEFRSLDYFNDLIKTYQFEGLAVSNVEAGGRLWFAFNQSAINSVHVDLQVKSLSWTVDGQEQAPLTDLATAISWGSADGIHSIQVSQLGFEWNGGSWPKTNIDLLFGNDLLLVQADKLDLGILASMFSQTNLPNQKLKERLINSDPGGFLENVYFQTVLSDSDEHGLKQHMLHELAAMEVEHSPSFVLKANLRDVSALAYRGAPGGGGIDGYIEAADGDGRVLLKSNNFSLNFPKLFLEGWTFQDTSASIGWHIDGDHAFVFSEGIQLGLDEKRLLIGDFVTSINPAEVEDFIELRIAFQDIPVDEAVLFTPYYTIDQSLYEWLDKALQGGQVSSGSVALFGSTERKAAKNSFTTSLQLAIEDGVVEYDSKWPAVESLHAQLDLQESQLDISATAARIRSNDLSGLQVHLPMFKPGQEQRLDVSAHAQLNASDIDYWLGESPLADATGEVPDILDFEGILDLGLALDIGFEKDSTLGYDVRAKLDDLAISYPQADLRFDQIEGILEVSSERGLLASGLKAVLLDQPISIDIDSEVSQDSLISTRFMAQGRHTLSTWTNHYDLASLPAISGDMDWLAELYLPIAREAQANAVPRLQIRSDTRGLEVNWPSPFAKTMGGDRPFVADVWFGDETRVETRWDDLLSSDTTIRSGEHAGSHLYLKQDLPWPRESVQPGLRVSGETETVDVEAWVAFVNEHFTAGGEDDSLLREVDIQIDKLLVYGQTIQDTAFKLGPRNGRWAAEVLSEQAKGVVRLESGDDPLALDFEYLAVSTPESEDEDSDAGQSFDPRSIPALTFEADELVLNGKPYGAWKARAEPQENGIIFRDAQGTIAGSTLTGQLNWQMLESGEMSILTADITGKDSNKFLSNFGYKDLIRSKRFNTSLSLVWPDAPDAISVDKLSGKLGVKLKEGQIYKSTGADSLRLLGILNADTLSRRLKLDFSDLYESGIAYDELNVKASIDQGNMVFTDPLIISGPSSKIVFTGETNLDTESVEMDMTVELPLAQNVPLAALALGAPQVGGAVWLVDKLLGEPLNSLSSVRYMLTGTWDEPILTPVNVPARFMSETTKKKGSGG